MIENIPLPRLLNSSGGTERRISAQRVSINLAIVPLSDAEMVLSQEESLPARSYVELYTCLGSAGIFRVRSPKDSYGTVSTTAELEHAIVEVGDYLVKAEYNQMMAANTAIQTIFGHYGGSKWQLGSLTAIGSGQVAVKVNYNRVLDAILGILEQKPECMLSFDFSTTPWTLNIVSRETIVSAEGRLARNVNYAKITYDDTELCTRAYYESSSEGSSAVSDFPTFDASKNYSKGYYVNYNNKLYNLPNGHVAGVTWANTTKTEVTDVPTTAWSHVDADTIGTYGVVEREVRTGSNYTPEEALRVAQEYLNKHKHPRVSVEISAAEMSHITGEAIDSFGIGKLYRLALADYNMTVEKTITGMYFPDVYGLPDSITVNLAEEEDTALNFIHDLDAKGGGGGGGGGAKQQDDKFKEFRTHFEQDDYHFKLWAERVDITEHILQEAGMYINHQGVLIYAEDNVKMMGSKIKAEADRISLVVEGYGANASIKPAAIVASINNGASTILISADHISIDGDTLVTKISGIDAQFSNLLAGNTQFAVMWASTAKIGAANITEGMNYQSSPVLWKSQEVVTNVTTSGSHYFMYASDPSSQTPSGSASGMLVSSVSKETIYYLGRNASS